MYESFFELKEKPFNVTPDPRFFYGNPIYNEAYANLLYAVRERKGFATLIGEVGTGKTTLLRKLTDELAIIARFVYFYNTNLTFEELLSFTCEELKLRVSRRVGRLGRIRALNQLLVDQLRSGRTVALLIDEAQNLSKDVLENLRLLSNLETGREKLLQIILAGQPEFATRLEEPDLRQLRQRISIHCRIQPLDECEVARFISYRLSTAGYVRNDLFTPEAVRKIACYSRGAPRLINIICDNALLIAYANSQRRVRAAIIDEVGNDLLGGAAERGNGLTISGDIKAVRHARAGSFEDAVPGNGWAGSRDIEGVAAEMCAGSGNASIEKSAADDGMLPATAVLQLRNGGVGPEPCGALAGDEFAVVSKIDGQRDVQTIAQSLSRPYEWTATVVKRLCEAGIVRPVAVNTPDAVPERLFDILAIELTEVIGPMSTFLIRERADALGYSPKSFPAPQFQKLVEALSSDIRDDRPRDEFRKRMAKAIGRLNARDDDDTPKSKNAALRESWSCGLPIWRVFAIWL